MNEEQKQGGAAIDLLKQGFAEAERKKQEQEAEKKGVHVDFNRVGKSAGPSPFQKAKALGKRLKALIWGDSGVGKTTLALQFPRPVVIDAEGGTDLYGDAFGFDVIRTTDPDEIIAAVDWLLTNRHEYRTLVVDPITVLWEALQNKWSDIFLRRNKTGKGFKHEFYDFQMRDWLTIKSEWKEFIRKLITLDMNVIVTAREKTKYKDGASLQVVGETFDGEKSLPYMFDLVLRLHIDEKGRHIATVLKDRSNRLPKEDFECKYEEFEKLFGKQSLSKKATPVTPASEEQKSKIKKLIEHFKLTTEQVQKRLAAYGAESIGALTQESAQTIISKLEEAKSKQKPAETGKEKSNA